MAEVYHPVMCVSHKTTTITTTRWTLTREELENLIRRSADLPESANISFDLSVNDWNDMVFDGVTITHVSETNDYGL